MPLRVKARPRPEPGSRQRTPSPLEKIAECELPDIDDNDSFRVVVKKVSIYMAEVVTLPCSFEQLRTTAAGDGLRSLVSHLTAECNNKAIVNALLALKWHYTINCESGEKTLGEARANACEIVAWRFLTHLSEREAVQYCLYEIPDSEDDAHDSNNNNNNDNGPADNGRSQVPYDEESGCVNPDETTVLLPQLPHSALPTTSGSARRTPSRPGSSAKKYQLLQSLSRLTMTMGREDDDDEAVEDDEDPTRAFISLNALEIAAIADAKRFLSQDIVQKIVTGIWNGDIIFWDELSIHTVKKPRFYRHSTADPYSRLRVPKYLKSFEVVFFASFLCLYYAVLYERDSSRITPLETALYIWFAAFFYDEMSELMDAGSIFYTTDIWNLFDMIMLLIGIVFATLRGIGLYNGDRYLIELSFDVLSLEALFMVPRIASVLSLSPYWGTLLPCLKAMLKDFIKFMVLVVIVYLGFLTTFSLIGRDRYPLASMTMILTKIFFGSSYVGFEIMSDIDPVFGPPLMLIFITLSSILLMGSLTGMLSNSFSRVISHAREEYLYVYSVYVLEASTSNRLTHFYPPFNLLALIIFRPLRLFLPSDSKFRAARIWLLKATHWPIVGAIKLYELIRGHLDKMDDFAGFKGPRVDSKRMPAYRKRTTGRPGMGRRQSHAGSYRRSPRPVSSTEFHSAMPQFHNEDTMIDIPSEADVRIQELSIKIDRLTELVLSMQEQRPTGEVQI
ncbi:hypothetical protein RB594_007581 [Gaeumannomyces avenae]